MPGQLFCWAGSHWHRLWLWHQGIARSWGCVRAAPVYLFIYLFFCSFIDVWQVQGLRAPLGQGWCYSIPSQGTAKCSTHHSWFPLSALYSYSPPGTYFRDLTHKMREIYLSQVSQGGSKAGEGSWWCWAAKTPQQLLGTLRAQARHAGRPGLALFSVLLLGAALN